MGYSIDIGEAIVERGDMDYGERGGHWVTVADVEHPEAPKLPGDTTGQSNSRSPGYVQWHDFTREAGIESLWYDRRNGFLREHPGAFPLTREDYDQVREALNRWQASHPDAVAGWCECAKCGWNRESTEPHRTERCGILGRLVWLEWWMRWALENCKNPTVCNS